MVVICAGCERPILDRFLLNVLDRAWHAACVKCCDCKSNLTEKCFSRDGKLFCRQDFFRRFGTKCGGCAQEISPNELVRRARSRVYHLKCFTCLVCRKQLSTGEELYMIDENRFICREDYLAKFQNGDIEDNDLDLDPSTFENTEDAFSDKDVSTHDDDDDDDDASRDSITGHPLVNNNPSNNNNNKNNGCIGSGNPGLLVGPIGGPAGRPHSVSSHFVGGGPGAQLDGGIDAGVPGGPIGVIGGPGGIGGLIKQEKLNNATDSNCSVDSLCSNENPAAAGGGGGGGGGTTGTGNTGSNSGTGSGHKDSGGADAADNGGPNNKDATDNPSAGKRRGPRTTIKAKQLETLKAAFAATPKPTRHIREQLAQETGLNMRVIQVWFQNRRSKERRMKQLSALGVRRQFYRNPRRLRALRPGEDLADELGQPGFNYFVENADFYPGYPGYGDYFTGHHPVPDPEAMSYLPPTSGHQPNSHLLDQVTGQSIHDGPFLPGELGLRPNGSPEPPPPSIGALHHEGHFGGPHGLPHHPMAGLHGPFGRYPGLRAPPHADMPTEIW